MEDFTKEIDDYLGRFSRVLDSVSRKEVWEASNLLLEALSNGSKIFVIAEDATVAERIELILSRCRFGRTDKRFNCQSLCQNLGNLTDITADDYKDVFTAQLDGMMDKEDILIAVSYDGERKNIVRAAEYSKICGCKILALTGGHGGKLAILSNAQIHFSDNKSGMHGTLSVIIVGLIADLLTTTYR